MKRALLPLMASLALLPASVMAEVLPLALSGPAYHLANEAYLAYDRKDYDQAVAKAREALRQRPDVSELNDLVKLALRDKDRRDHPERYPDARPKPGYLAGNQSLREYRNGHYDAAARAALKAISQAPENLDYRLMLIEALQRQQKLEQAHAATTEAIATLGPQPELVRRRQAIEEQQSVVIAAKGYEALAQGDNDKAVSLAHDVVQRYPQNVAYRRLLVSALIAHQQYEAARAAASEALALQGNDATLLAQRGQLRQRLGDDAGARQDYAQALAVGNLPDRERAALYAAMGQPDTALRYLQQARAKGELQAGDEVQIAYFLSQAGEQDQALATFRQVDRSTGLKPVDLRNAAYTAQRSGNDVQAIAYFERVLDYQRAGTLDMSEQEVFDTRRSVADLSRQWSLTNTSTYRGASTSSGLGGAPGASNDSLQNSTEVAWRPLGYNNARFFELYGRLTDTLWSKDDNDTGRDALQGALGIRFKPLSAYNVMLALERTFPLAGSNVDGDWLVRLGYGSSIGTDLRVDKPSWWTSQLYMEAGRYLQNRRNYFNSEWQIGRSIRLDRISRRLVIFPHIVAAADYDSKMRSQVDDLGRQRSSSGNAGGVGVGVGVRYWMRETRSKAPQSYIDLSLQYRERVFGDDRAEGVFARFTYSW
ncbi:peptidase aspartic, active site [Pseudomonas sp. StFLB209]|uniref:NfrA family protein n=1 Tax=Pseudomonas sp. StFLB209 TaxID=1028989 RepID=UPI0004F7DB0D|nr:tetratricopeptide repeat protein [Pseudomonas sp. StFLB209]BAP46001.1 peptidase aspartic, active site [Pseudomonas sp. StFLB209]